MAEQLRSTSAIDGPSSQTPRGPLILVVDDDPVILEMLAEALEDEGYATATTPHGKAALAFLTRRRAAGEPPPDLILLDMRMPIMDGWAFADAYRCTPGPHAPIVVITAAHDAHARTAEIDAAAVLAKPFNLDDLLGAVARCVGHLSPGSIRATGP